MILDEMSSAKCCLLFVILKKYFIAQHEEKPLYQIHMVTSRYKLILLYIVTHALYVRKEQVEKKRKHVDL